MSEVQEIPIANPQPPLVASRFARPASDAQLERTASALRDHGIETYVTEDAAGARRKVLELVPAGSAVFTATSETLRTMGLDSDFNESPSFQSLRNSMMKLYQEGHPKDASRLVATPDYVVGSVHAVTEGGEILVASRSGSQLGPYLYGAEHVVWVVGAQKVVRDLNEGLERIHDYALPLEDARARRTYGRGSAVAKLAVIYFDDPGRSSLVFVRQALGF